MLGLGCCDGVCVVGVDDCDVVGGCDGRAVVFHELFDSFEGFYECRAG